MRSCLQEGKEIQSLGYSSVSRLLALQASSPEFDPQNPQERTVDGGALNPRAGEAEPGGQLELAG